MRELKAGDQCEYTEKIGDPYTSYKNVRCETKHLHRVDGKPQQLVVIKEGRVTRFVCTKHAPSTEIKHTVRKQKKSDHMAEQVELL